MKIDIMIKSSGRTRGVESRPYIVRDCIATLGDLINNLVDIEIDKYEKDELIILSQEDLDEMLARGKVSFGFRYNDKKVVDRPHAKSVALQAFEDGLFTVFINESQVESADSRIHLKENDNITLVRFTMLTGIYY